MLQLTVEKRETTGKNDALRAGGKIPAVFYGPKQPSVSVAISAPEFKKVWKKAGESSVIILKENSGTEHEALIYDVDTHPLSGEPRHVDFYVVEKGKKIQVAVPLSFTGVSPAVKDKGAILVKVSRELKIEASPRDLPHEIAVDISKLVEYNDSIHAKDIVLPSGVALKVNPEDVIVSVTEAKAEVEETSTTIDMSAIEVEAKGKEVKEGEGEDAAAKTDDKKSPESKK